MLETLEAGPQTELETPDDLPEPPDEGPEPRKKNTRRTTYDERNFAIQHQRPSELALRWNDGKRVDGRYGEQVMFTLDDDRVMYVPPVVAKQIRDLGIRAREVFEICKAELREENKRWIEWHVRKSKNRGIRHRRQTHRTPRPSGPNNDAQNHRNGNTQNAQAAGFAGLAGRHLAAGSGDRGRHNRYGVGHERGRRDCATRRVPRPHAQLLAAVHQRRYPGHRADHVHPGHARARCDMGSALTLDVIRHSSVQMSFPCRCRTCRS